MYKQIKKIYNYFIIYYTSLINIILHIRFYKIQFNINEKEIIIYLLISYINTIFISIFTNSIKKKKINLYGNMRTASTSTVPPPTTQDHTHNRHRQYRHNSNYRQNRHYGNNHSSYYHNHYNHDDNHDNETENILYTYAKNNKLCYFHMLNQCKYGQDCQFTHGLACEKCHKNVFNPLLPIQNQILGNNNKMFFYYYYNYIYI